jgi:periplasmic protein TonB
VAHKPKGLRFSSSTGLFFAVAADGTLLAASVSRSSGNTNLDRFALQTLQNASPFPTPPASLRAKPLTFMITFEFH